MNCELWVIMMYHCRLISCNKCTTLVGDVDNGGGYACIGAGSTKEISVPYSQLFYTSKTTLKKKKRIVLNFLAWPLGYTGLPSTRYRTRKKREFGRSGWCSTGV